MKAWITDSAGTILSRADQANYDFIYPLELFAPVRPSSPYYLFVQNDGGARATDYYYALRSFDLESLGSESTTAHGTAATAQALLGPLNVFIAGTLSTPNEADWYTFAAGTGATSLSIGCSSAREGAGLQGFTATVDAADGTTVLGALTESETDPLYASDVPIPASSAAKIHVKLTATGQDPAVIGDFYECTMAAYPSP